MQLNAWSVGIVMMIAPRPGASDANKINATSSFLGFLQSLE
jgi:hypothetical protein